MEQDNQRGIYKVKIYYHDTDAGSVVYYANYLKFLEEARTEFFRERGIGVKELISKGVLFVVSRQEIDYKLPAFYGDILGIQTKVSKMSAVKIIFEYEVRNGDSQLVALARTVLVCVDKNFKPQALPDGLRGKLIVTSQ